MRRWIDLKISKATEILAFAVSGIFTVALLTFLWGFWGRDELEIVFTVPGGLFLMSMFFMIMGVILWYINGLRAEIGMLKQVGESLKQEKGRLEERVENMEQERINLLSQIEQARQESAAPKIDYHLEIKGGKVIRGNKEIFLAPEEFELLKCLMNKDKEVYEYDHIFKQVWPQEYDPGKPKLAALILRLRHKINVHDYIKNHRRGYEFVQWEE